MLMKLFVKPYEWSLTDELFEIWDLQLFKSVCLPNHCLHYLLPLDRKVL